MSESDELLGAIAVIGLAGRFPGAPSVDEFWQNLQEGVESLHTFTDEELASLGVPPEVYRQPDYVRAAMPLAGADMFDADFFGFSPMEARIRDPQHRLFLECAWEALEDAGYNPHRYDGQIGVFGGCSPSYYGHAIPFDADPVLLAEAYQREIGSKNDYLCTTASYKLGLKGPAVTTQTACSTSLVAVCLACQNLMTYQCDMVLAGGASVNTRQKAGYFYQEGMVLSPDGHCRAFDANARGTVLGQGVGVVLLKRLSDALNDGDTVHAVIKGFAVNNDGGDKVGYTAPSVNGQAEVIAMAQALSGIPIESIGYIEAHGTGTPLGDPIEIAALNRAFRQSTEKKAFCAIGSLKTNVGHLDAAAGVAGLIKTVLMLKHRQIPASLHFTAPNPEIDFADSPFYVNSQLSEWNGGGHPLRAGVSSFGIGGTNAHVVLEEAPALEEASDSRPWQLLLLSAKSEVALEAATRNLGEYLSAIPTANLADVAYTLSVGRKAFSHRRFAVCETTAAALEAFRRPESHAVHSREVESPDPKVIFMFPGQGSQYVNMGRNLYEQEPLFRAIVDQCAEILEPEIQADLRGLLYPDRDQLESAAEQLRMTRYQQPALLTIEYALAKLWQEWGVQPAAVLGHSIGEYTAACLAGIFALEDALRLVAARGRMMQQLPTGSMLSVRSPAAELQPRLDGRLALAAVNAPALSVVSGPTEAIQLLQQDLEREEVMCRVLHTSHAFHSSVMDSIVGPFAELVQTVPRAAPEIPLVSTATGTWMTTAEANDPRYWAQQLRNTVRFADSIATVLADADAACVLLEVGPRKACATFARQLVTDREQQFVVSSLGDAADEQAEWDAILSAMGHLWLSGVELVGDRIYQHERRHRVPLPTYPFQRKRYWEEPACRAAGATGLPSASVTRSDDINSCDSSRGEDGAEFPSAGRGEAYDDGWTKSEVLVADTWKTVLGTKRIALNDNYFSDLGGDSLSVLRVIETVRRETGSRLDPNIFLVNTLRQIAAHISQQQPAGSPYAEETTPAQPSATSASQSDKEATMRPLYFGEGNDRLFGIYDAPKGPSIEDTGVLLCYPLGQEYMVSHWAFRRLSQLMSEAGLPVFRFDYSGTGDSAGASGEGTVSRWKADTRAACDHLQQLSGCNQVSILGLRMGAALAAKACAEGLQVRELVLWDPVISGKAYLEDLSRYAVRRNHPSGGKTDELVGFPFPPAMRASIEQIDLLRLGKISAERVLVMVSKLDEDILKLQSRIRSLGSSCECQQTAAADRADEAGGRWEGEDDILEDGLLPIRVEVLSTLAALLNGAEK